MIPGIGHESEPLLDHLVLFAKDEAGCYPVGILGKNKSKYYREHIILTSGFSG